VVAQGDRHAMRLRRLRRAHWQHRRPQRGCRELSGRRTSVPFQNANSGWGLLAVRWHATESVNGRLGGKRIRIPNPRGRPRGASTLMLCVDGAALDSGGDSSIEKPTALAHYLLHSIYKRRCVGTSIERSLPRLHADDNIGVSTRWAGERSHMHGLLVRCAVAQ
jgi:hypothetical protein